MSATETTISLLLAASLCASWIFYENPALVEHPVMESIVESTRGILRLVPDSFRKRFSFSADLISWNTYEHSRETVQIFAFSAAFLTVAIILWHMFRMTPKKVDGSRNKTSKSYNESTSFIDDDYSSLDEDELHEHTSSDHGSRRTPYERPAVRMKSSNVNQRVYAIDCEMCDVEDARTERNFKFPIRVAIVNEDLEVEYCQYICPSSRYIIVDDLSRIHGITEPTFRKYGIPFAQAQQDVLELVYGHITTGHDLQHDFKALGIQHEISSLNIRDTAWTRMFMTRYKTGFRPRKLVQLARDHLGIKMRTTGLHDPVEDAEVSMRLFKKYRHLDWVVVEPSQMY